jgi:hypothetical protein
MSPSANLRPVDLRFLAETCYRHPQSSSEDLEKPTIKQTSLVCHPHEGK